MKDRLVYYNTLTRSPERVGSAASERVTIYSCGPTVYRYVHLGNLRTFILADLVARAASYAGFDVRQVMNITDVGHLTDETFETGRDKMLLAAETEGKSPSEIADFYTAAFFEDASAVGISLADAYPRASQHVPQMLELIERLIERGHAYVADGNVYYDVSSFDRYGVLSGNTLERLREGHRKEIRDPNKRNPQDFLLWRKATEKRLVKFDSPWGEGFPGWHIECSAMSLAYLGHPIDVHTGGVDLIFPHHEDEIAQSEGAVGSQVVRIWIHGAHLLAAGQKMAKSSLNDLRITRVAERGHDPLSFRYLCFTARYRKPLDFSWEALGSCDRALKRLRARVADALSAASGMEAVADAVPPPEAKAELSPAARSYDARFADAVLADLDMPRALGVLHEMVADAHLSPQEQVLLVLDWERVLALGLLPPSAASHSDTKDQNAADTSRLVTEVETLVRQRTEARRKKDYSTADRIRSDLEARGVELVDTPSGTTWKFKEKTP